MKKIGRCDHIVNTWKTDSCSGILKLTMTQVKPTHWKGKPWNCRASLVLRFVEPPGQVLRHKTHQKTSLFVLKLFLIYMMNKNHFSFSSAVDLGFWLKKTTDVCTDLCKRPEPIFPIFLDFFLQLFVVQLLHDDDDDENEANFVHKVGPNFSLEFIEAKIV